MPLATCFLTIWWSTLAAGHRGDMATKTPPLTLKDLQTAATIDDLPTMVPLLDEVTRLSDEHTALNKDVWDAGQRVRGPSSGRPTTATECDQLTSLTRDGFRRLVGWIHQAGVLPHPALSSQTVQIGAALG